MSGTLTNPALRAAVEAALPKYTRSKQQEEAFRQGAAVVENYVTEAGVADTILPKIRQEVTALRQFLNRVEEARQECDAVFEPTALDERARSVIALTASLKKILAPIPPGEYRSAHYTNDVGNNERTATRAISYIVWAYLTNGQPTPAELTKDEEKS